MENIVKQIQLIALVIILISTVIAFGQEMYQMIMVKRVSLADLLLLFPVSYTHLTLPTKA